MIDNVGASKLIVLQIVFFPITTSLLFHISQITTSNDLFQTDFIPLITRAISFYYKSASSAQTQNYKKVHCSSFN